MENMELYISQLVEYAVQKCWISEEDRVWAANRVLEVLHMDGFDGLVSLSPVNEGENSQRLTHKPCVPFTSLRC